MARRACVLIMLLTACSSSDVLVQDAATPEHCERTACGVARVEPAEPVALRGCTFASPVAYDRADGTEVLLVTSETLSALSLDGELLWSLTLPAPDDEMALAVATPVRIGHRLVVGYHTVERTTEPHDLNRERLRQRVVIVDLEARRIDEAFEPLDLHAEFPANDDQIVTFTATNTLGRALAHVATDGELGLVYATFGSGRPGQAARTAREAIESSYLRASPIKARARSKYSRSSSTITGALTVRHIALR